MIPYKNDDTLCKRDMPSNTASKYSNIFDFSFVLLWMMYRYFISDYIIPQEYTFKKYDLYLKNCKK